MQPGKDLKLEEKIFLIEYHGCTAAEVHQDPNRSLAFTLFPGPDPGATPDDEDYSRHSIKRKLEAESTGHTSPVKRTKQLHLPDRGTPATTDKVRVWQEDEVMFVLSRYAEWPEIGNSELAALVNEEFQDKPVFGGNRLETRGLRSRQSVWQRFWDKSVSSTLIARLDEQTDKNAASMGWAAKGPQEETETHRAEDTEATDQPTE